MFLAIFGHFRTKNIEGVKNGHFWEVKFPLTNFPAKFSFLGPPLRWALEVVPVYLCALDGPLSQPPDGATHLCQNFGFDPLVPTFNFRPKRPTPSRSFERSDPLRGDRLAQNDPRLPKRSKPRTVLQSANWWVQSGPSSLTELYYRKSVDIGSRSRS